MRMKRFLGLIIGVLLLCYAMPFAAQAEPVDQPLPEGWTYIPISATENSTHIAYRIENGVLTFKDFGDASMDGYGVMPNYANSKTSPQNYDITQWYKQRGKIKHVIFDETISYVGTYTLINMNYATQIHIQNASARVSKNAVLFSVENRTAPLSIYAASTVSTVDSWIRGSSNRKISQVISSVTFNFTDMDHLLPKFETLKESLNAGVAMDDKALYEALLLLNEIPQHNYAISDYRCTISGVEEVLALLNEMRSGVCGDALTYTLDATEQEDGCLMLTISGTGEMFDYEDPTQVPWYYAMDCIRDVKIGESVSKLTLNALPQEATYHVRLNSYAYPFLQSKHYKIQLDNLSVLCIGNSHTMDYSAFRSSILADMKNVGLQTKITFERATTGGIGLYSGRHSNTAADYHSHLLAIQNKDDGVYIRLRDNRYDLIIVQDYMESVVDDPVTFSAGLSTFIQTIKTVAAENGHGSPQVAWFADWVDIRSSGGDKALYDINGNKIALERLDREQVYKKSLLNIEVIEAAIAQNVPNMPDFVIHASTIKQNAMSSYLGTTKLWDRTSYCLLERDTTHLTYELGRYLLGAGVIREILTNYDAVLSWENESVDVADALTVENGPVVEASGCQYEGSVNENILNIIREAISSPDAFKQSAYVVDPVNEMMAEMKNLVWDVTEITDAESAETAIKTQIEAAYGQKLDSYSVKIKEYISARQFSFDVCIFYGYSKASATLEVKRMLSGDLDGNGSVDDEDVIYLLWHTLMSDEYPVNQPVDFDHNGSVDDEDVIYLLWHTLMPTEYPL